MVLDKRTDRESGVQRPSRINTAVVVSYDAKELGYVTGIGGLNASSSILLMRIWRNSAMKIDSDTR